MKRASDGVILIDCEASLCSSAARLHGSVDRYKTKSIDNLQFPEEPRVLRGERSASLKFTIGLSVDINLSSIQWRASDRQGRPPVAVT